MHGCLNRHRSVTLLSKKNELSIPLHPPQPLLLCPKMIDVSHLSVAK